MKPMKCKEPQNENAHLGEKSLEESRETIDLEFGHYLATAKYHWVSAIGVFCFTLFIFSLLTFLLKPSYQARGKLLFENQQTSIFSDPEKESEHFKSLLETQTPLSTQIEILTSNHLLTQLISRRNLQNEKGKRLESEDLLQQLSVKIIGGTDVLEISYENQHSVEAAQVVNTLMKIFIENEIRVKQLKAIETKRFITREIPQAELALRQADVALLAFKQKHRVLLLPKEIEAAVLEISKLESQINTIQGDLSESTSRFTQLQNQLGIGPQAAVAVGKLSQSTAVQGQLQQLQQVQRRITELQSGLQPDHPTINDLKAKQPDLERALALEVQQVLGSAAVPTEFVKQGKLNLDAIAPFIAPDIQQQNYAQLTKDVVTANLQQQGQQQKSNNLIQKLRSYQMRKQSLTNLEQQQQVLENKVQAARATYDTLLKKAQEVEVSKNEARVNARIIDVAVSPREPVNRKKLLILAVGTLLGIFLASLTPLVLSHGDRRRNQIFKGVSSDLKRN
jgi:polysaccharide biosynthesis transport protein